jgi:hypothetical protein
MVSPAPVTYRLSPVILSEAKDLAFRLRINSAKDLVFRLEVNSAKGLGIGLGDREILRYRSE